jgi:hypothetical protein
MPVEFLAVIVGEVRQAVVSRPQGSFKQTLDITLNGQDDSKVR